MKAPRLNKKIFPPSWRKWRKLKVGEAFRASDRVVATWVINKFGITKHRINSMPMGPQHVGFVVNPNEPGNSYPYGWYYRKVS